MTCTPLRYTARPAHIVGKLRPLGHKGSGDGQESTFRYDNIRRSFRNRGCKHH